MLKYIKIAALTLMLPIIVQANSYKEGVHYEVVSERATKKPEVTEYFSFYCPACNNFESLLNDVKPKLNSNVTFKKSHVDFTGPRDPELQAMMAKGLAMAESLPQKDTLITAIFSHIHTKRAKFNEQNDLKDVFVANGVDAQKFDKLYKSFSIRTKASKMKRMQKQWSDKRVITGVPTFIVNGKYKLKLRESKTTTPEQISALINYLADK